MSLPWCIAGFFLFGVHGGAGSARFRPESIRGPGITRCCGAIIGPTVVGWVLRQACRPIRAGGAPSVELFVVKDNGGTAGIDFPVHEVPLPVIVSGR